jgi:hypothetical protein
MEDKGKSKLEDAVQEYIRENAGGDEIVTGWVIGVSLKNRIVPNSDGYVVDQSAGMPYHSQIGLLTAVLEEKKNTILSQIIREGSDG